MKFSVALVALLDLLSFVNSDKKTIIYIIRHGVRGRINLPLNDLGITHFRAAEDFFS